MRACPGRVFSVDRGTGYGVSALFGRYLAGGSMAFARAGVVFQDFKTNYQTPAPNAFVREERDFGLRFGLGGRLPISPHLAFRLEYDYAMFGDYMIGPPNGPDRFANNEGAAWFGLTYSFQPSKPPIPAVPGLDFSGPYWGLQAGLGAIASRTTGIRDEGGGPSILTADFSDTGLTGSVFAGYGRTVNRLYAGVEVEAGYSNAAWDHERVPSGSSFTVGKREAFGAGLRLGYVVDGTGMLYGRIGVVRTGFGIGFDRGMNSVRATEHATGLRLGLGMELAVSENFALRFDHTYTPYGTLHLVTPPDGDVESYKTDDNVFSVGAVFRR